MHVDKSMCFEMILNATFRTICLNHPAPNNIQRVQLKSGPYFNTSNLFTKIYNMLYYTTNLYLQ
jgi:hypothetical protein